MQAVILKMMKMMNCHVLMGESENECWANEDRWGQKNEQRQEQSASTLLASYNIAGCIRYRSSLCGRMARSIAIAWRIQTNTTGDHLIAVTADFQGCIEDGTAVSQIVRQRTLAATAALTLA